jgi:phosphoglycerate dehydrogenase-like enzyme
MAAQVADASRSAVATSHNVVLTPHIDAMTSGSQARIGRLVVEGRPRAAAGLAVPNTVVGGR